jgi:hypothetical protein
MRLYDAAPRPVHPFLNESPRSPRGCFRRNSDAFQACVGGVLLGLYQACPVSQLGHVTQVVTAAVKLIPQ